ncbi:MAG: S1C family serine protease [Pseudonocardiaceae bacterium]
MTDDTSRPGQPDEPGAHPDPYWAATGQPESSWSPERHPASGANQPTAPIGPPSSAVPGPRGGATLKGAVVLSLLVALVAGGVGGAVGYHFASGDSSVSSALDLPTPQAVPAASLPAGSVEQVAQKVTPSVVQLRVRGAGMLDEGSGIVLSPDGLILTNNHVVEAAVTGSGAVTAVLQDGRTVPVQIVGRAPSFDLAVVRAQGVSGLTPAQLGSSNNLLVGQPVVAIGSPLGLSGTVTSGIVSALDRPVLAGGEGSGQETVLDAIQTDAAINPGNSGGPLTDMQGRVIGINSAIASLGVGASGQPGSIGLGFAIPIDQARRIATELLYNGQATQSVLGVSVPVGQQPETAAAVVMGVTPGSAAAAAGIQAGEMITKVDNRVIDSGDSLIAAIRSYPPGSRITMTVKNSAGTSRQVQVTLGSQQVGVR